jgi:hypothetical protein
VSWADDKARIAELGVGPMLLCAFLVVLTFLGVLTFAFVWQVASRLGDEYSNSQDMTPLIWRSLGLTAMRPTLFLVSAIALFYSRSRWAVFLTVSAIVLTNYSAVLMIPKAIDALKYGVGPPLMLADVAIGLAMLIGIPTYLLLSKHVDELYGVGLRHTILRGTANSWQRFRNRPTIDEIEADRLNDTFN